MNAYIDELQDRINELADKVEDLEFDNEHLRDKLEELVQTKPIPCTFDGDVEIADYYTDGTWIKKLHEEVGEVEKAVGEWKRRAEPFADFKSIYSEHLAEELTDVITVCTSFLEWLGYDEKSRGEKQREVNEKNKARGYW